jgi:hypothetical protein
VDPEGPLASESGRARNHKRRDPGDGSIFQRSDGRWVAGLRDSAGRPRYLYAKDRAHAKQRLTEAQTVVHTGQPLPDQRVTFGRYLLDWVAGLGAASFKPRNPPRCRYISEAVQPMRAPSAGTHNSTSTMSRFARRVTLVVEDGASLLQGSPDRATTRYRPARRR